MSFWEYDAERHLKIEKEDSYNDGFLAGIKSEQKNTLREKERADTAETRANVEKNRADAAENRADTAEQELTRLREELRKLRGEFED